MCALKDALEIIHRPKRRVIDLLSACVCVCVCVKLEGRMKETCRMQASYKDIVPRIILTQFLGRKLFTALQYCIYTPMMQ